jgi:hypothetical protein
MKSTFSKSKQFMVFVLIISVDHFPIERPFQFPLASIKNPLNLSSIDVIAT